VKTPQMLKIGILGVGAIGRTIAAALDQKQVDADLVALSDQDRAGAEALSSELSNHPAVVSIDEMIERCDLAVEAASQAALPEFVPKALARGPDMLIMSVGGLLGHEEWFRQARERSCRIYVPSGPSREHMAAGLVIGPSFSTQIRGDQTGHARRHHRGPSSRKRSCDPFFPVILGSASG